MYYLTKLEGVVKVEGFDDITINVEKTRKVYIPNAFSPNSDGYNDYFTIYGGIDVEEIVNFQVFDRWGELVYESNDASELNDLSQGWDGTFKGNLQNVGTFVYFIQATDNNGISVETQGNLTLIR